MSATFPQGPRADGLSHDQSDDSRRLSSAAVRACGIEIGVHAAALLGVVLPIYALGGPLSFLQEIVWAGSSVAGRLAGLLGVNLPSSAQLLFEGKIAWLARIIGLLVLVASFLFYKRALKTESGTGATLYSSPKGRRYREIPAAVRGPLEEQLQVLWSAARTSQVAPPLWCFPATDVAACALKDGRLSIIAVSTGLLERFGKDDARVDSLIRVILLHEISHILRGDQIRFPQAKALLRVCRMVILTVLIVMALTFSVWSVMDKLGVGAARPSDASVAAYVQESIRAVSFAYLGLIVVQRYASFLLMLIELRADVTAARMGAGLAAFVRAVSEDGAIRREGIAGWLRTLVGMKVSHMTSRERAALLDNQDRLLTPKLRYFTYLLVLPVLLLVNGYVAFTPFEWVLRAGMLAITLALNVLCVLMVANAGSVSAVAVSTRRLFMVSSVVVLANLILFTDVYGVVMRSGELVTAAVDPNFREPLTQVASHATALAKTLAEPYITATETGRLAVWIGVAFVVFILLMRARITPSKRMVGCLNVTVILGTVVVFLSSLHGPNTAFKVWFRSSNFGRTCSDWLGPVFGLVSAAPIVLVCLAARRRSRGDVRNSAPD